MLTYARRHLACALCNESAGVSLFFIVCFFLFIFRHLACALCSDSAGVSLVFFFSGTSPARSAVTALVFQFGVDFSLNFSAGDLVLVTAHSYICVSRMLTYADVC